VLIEAPAPRAGTGWTLPGLRIRPPWEEPATGSSREVEEIVIDPGQAFGTGGHATTRMCLELLLELASREGAAGPLLDVGTGSGVLAIAAARLGFHPVLAVDNEPESIEAARQNAAQNGVEIEVRPLDLRSQPLPWLDDADGSAGSLVVVANLLRPLLIEMAATMTAPPRHLLAGGLLSAEVDEAAEAFASSLNLCERARRRSGEWAAVWLAAP
jgi:ribosomal protein L11 methyltransferase